jgi:pre-mRNA-processing factor SLU7
MSSQIHYANIQDRWNGYDSRGYEKVISEFELLEAARKAKKEAERKAGVAQSEDGISDDEDKYEYEPDTPGQGYDEKTRTSTRNLRIREDIGMFGFLL